MSDITYSFIKQGFASIDAAKTMSTNIEGSIVFDKTHKVLSVGGDIYGAGIIYDVNLDEDTAILTITKSDGTTQTIDFSDTASATATLQIFAHQNELIGTTETTEGGKPTTKLDYSDTNYLTSQTNLVGADKELDSQIKSINDAIDRMEGTAGIATKTDGVVTIKAGVKQEDGVISNDTGDDITLKKVATTGAATDMTVTEPTDKWKTIPTGTTNLQTAIEKLDSANGDAKTVAENIADKTGLEIADDNTVTFPTGGDFAKKTEEEDSVIENDTNLADAIAHTADAVDTLKGDDQTEGSVAKTVKDAIDDIDGSATIATETNGVVTIKGGLAQTSGKISNSETDDITLDKVATTGNAEDVKVADTANHYTATTKNAETIFEEIGERIEELESLDTFDTIVSKDAATTPKGVKWMSGETEITGTLEASGATMHKIYLVLDTSSTKSGNYNEYLTIKEGTGETAIYTWELIGNTQVDLTGFVKTINVNGKDYAVAENTTKVTLPNVITGVKASDTESAKSTTETGFTTDYIVTKVTTDNDTASASEGEKNINLDSAAAVKVQDISTADNDNKGLAEASDVKDYVDSAIEDLDSEVISWEATETQPINPQYATTRVKEEDGKLTEVETITTQANVKSSKEDVIITKGSGTGSASGTQDELYVYTKGGTVTGKVEGETETKQFDVYTITDGDTNTGTIYVPAGETPNKLNTYRANGSEEATPVILTKVDGNQIVYTTAEYLVVSSEGLLTSSTIDDLNSIIANLNAKIAEAKAAADVVNHAAEVKVNDTNKTTIARIGTTDITVSVAGYWSVWE